jgi:hypothetical protein
MAKPSPPKFDILPKKQISDLERHLIRCNFRTRSNIDAMNSGHLNFAYVALEAIASIGPVLLDTDMPLDKANEAYPVKEWRENSVSIPAEFLQIIVDAWLDYEKNAGSKTFGQCLGIEHVNRQGKKPMVVWQAKMNNALTLSNEVVENYADVGGHVLKSLNEVMEEVAERHDVSVDTVKRAYKKRHKKTEEHVRFYENQRRKTEGD